VGGKEQARLELEAVEPMGQLEPFILVVEAVAEATVLLEWQC
jgi:hypothetical protein